MFQIKEYKVLFVFRLLYDFSLVVIGVKPFCPQDLADRTFKHQMWKDINSTQKHNLDNSEKWVCCHFEYPILLLSPIIIFRPHVSKIPYHLFAHIFLLQYITYPMCYHETKFLEIVYTVDHEVSTSPCNCVDWLLNLSRDCFGLHRGKNVKVTTEVEVPKRHLLRPTYIIHGHSPPGFVVREAK